MRTWTIAAAAALACFAAACGNDGEFENAGEELDDAVEDAGDALNEAVEDLDDGA
jgi:hypothetical protein